MSDLQTAFEKFEDLFTEISLKDMDGKVEKQIFLAAKTLRNIIDAVIDNDKVDKEKAKGILVRGIKTAASILARIKELPDISDSMKLLRSTVSFALKQQSALLETFK